MTGTRGQLLEVGRLCACKDGRENLIDELGFKNALFRRYAWRGMKLKRSDYWNEKWKFGSSLLRNSGQVIIMQCKNRFRAWIVYVLGNGVDNGHSIGSGKCFCLKSANLLIIVREFVLTIASKWSFQSTCNFCRVKLILNHQAVTRLNIRNVRNSNSSRASLSPSETPFTLITEAVSR